MAHKPAAGATVAPASPTHKTCTKCGETKVVTCFGKHKLGAGGLRAECKACSNAAKGIWERNNREKKLVVNRRARQKWYAANFYKDAERYLRWRLSNPEYVTERYRAWAKDNPDKVRAREARRRARERQACPAWVDHRAIDAVYAEAVRLTIETRIPHEVDHIIPLAGKNVCGLHVPWNLRAIPATENRSKSNKLLE